MKKLIIALMMVSVLLFAIPVSATDDTTFFESETSVETTIEAEQTEVEESVEALPEISENASFSEIVLAIADAFGVSTEKAEEMVASIRNLGDRYLSDSDLWDMIVMDMDAHPARWTTIGLLLAVVLVLIGLLIKRVISDSTALSKLKISVAGIYKALSVEGGDNPSIPTMIAEKNEQINTLVEENAVLSGQVEELTSVVRTLLDKIQKSEVNSDTSLKITEEMSLQILQLLNLALDRKTPVTTKEARALWYSATQSKIKEIYQNGVDSVENTEKT